MERDSNGPVSEKNGFSVVAPISTSRPSSTCGKQRVLLRAVEAVHLVEEEDGAAALLAHAGTGPLGHLAHVLHARGDRRQRLERLLGGARDQAGDRGLAGAGGPQRITDESRSASMSTRRGFPGPSRCCWPTTSSSDRGRSRAASGARPCSRSATAAENRSSGKAHIVRLPDHTGSLPRATPPG